MFVSAKTQLNEGVDFVIAQKLRSDLSVFEVAICCLRLDTDGSYRSFRLQNFLEENFDDWIILGQPECRARRPDVYRRWDENIHLCPNRVPCVARHAIQAHLRRSLVVEFGRV